MIRSETREFLPTPWRRPGGVLERLHEEAQARRDRAAVTGAAERACRDLAAQKLGRPLQLLGSYFRELAAQLGDVAPDVERRYEIPGAGELDGLRQGAYRVIALEGQGPGAFRFTFRCEGGAPRRFRVERARSRRLSQRLLEFGLRARVFDRGRLGAGIVLEASVPVSLDFAPDLERHVVALTATNLDVLGPMRYRLAPELVDATLADELAKRVLDEPSRFAEISGNTLSTQALERLRRRLDADRRGSDRRNGDRMGARVARWLGL